MNLESIGQTISSSLNGIIYYIEANAKDTTWIIPKGQKLSIIKEGTSHVKGNHSAKLQDVGLPTCDHLQMIDWEICKILFQTLVSTKSFKIVSKRGRGRGLEKEEEGEAMVAVLCFSEVEVEGLMAIAFWQEGIMEGYDKHEWTNQVKNE